MWGDLCQKISSPAACDGSRCYCILRVWILTLWPSTVLFLFKKKKKNQPLQYLELSDCRGWFWDLAAMCWCWTTEKHCNCGSEKWRVLCSIFLHATTLNIWVCAWNRTLVITQGRVVLLFEMDSSSCFGPRLLYGMQWVLGKKEAHGGFLKVSVTRMM